MREDGKRKRDQLLFDSVVGEYTKKDRAKSSFFARKHRLLSTIKPLRKHKISNILEIGCGAGYAAQYLRGLYNEYIGIDHSLNLIIYARKFNNFSNVSFENISIEVYTPNEKFDVILAIGVLHHLDDPKSALLEMSKWLKPGGVIVVNEPTTGNLLVGIARYLRKIVDKNYSNDQVEFSPDQLYDLFQQTDLSNIQCIPQGYFSTPFAEIVLRPIFLFYLLSILAIQLDKFIESNFSFALKKFSWNKIVIGYKKNISTD